MNANNTDATARAAGRALGRAAGATYCAGRAAGRWWHQHGVPAVLAAADGASWLVAEIDGAEALAIAAENLKALAALVISLVLEARQQLLQGSEALGRWYSRWLLQDDAPAAPAGPAVAAAVAVPTSIETAVPAAPEAPEGRRDRRRVHCPGLARWASSPDAEPPLWWSV